MRTLSTKQAIFLMEKHQKNRKRKIIHFDDDEHLATTIKRKDELYYDTLSDYIISLIHLDLSRDILGSALNEEFDKCNPLYEIADNLGMSDKVVQTNLMMRNKR